MSEQATFHALCRQNLDTLKQYVPIVAKVHGSHHTELHELNKAFGILCEKIEAAGKALPELASDWTALRRITDSYSIPTDSCETYEAVYRMLGELDRAYHAEAS